ncbi:MAG: bifunctional nuclease family protein [Verrucomicrobiia bacterium]
MGETLIPVRILGLMPADSGVAVFLGNSEKAFSIQVEHGIGHTIAMLLRGDKRERPLTHDLIKMVFQAFQITVERIVINDLRNDTYFARLTLKSANEVHKMITEIDARPSDCLAIALETKKPVYVAQRVWDQVTDLSGYFNKMKKKLEEPGSEEGGGDADPEED